MGNGDREEKEVGEKAIFGGVKEFGLIGKRSTMNVVVREFMEELQHVQETCWKRIRSEKGGFTPSARGESYVWNTGLCCLFPTAVDAGC